MTIMIQHPNYFKAGVRILMLTLRTKDGNPSNKPDRGSKKVISRNQEEFDEKFKLLMSLKQENERIYSTINQRDLPKAINLFKHRQLDAEMYSQEDHESFYVDIWNRWISSLQSPKSKKSSLFLVDIDEEDNEDSIKKEIAELDIDLIHEYDTKNGKHLILKPFNPNLVSFEIRTDSMMLLAY